MSPMRLNLARAIPAAGPPRAAGLGVKVATVLAVVATVLSGVIIWLTLSRPLEVVGALTGGDGWHIAVGLGRLLAGSAERLVAWL